MYRCILALALVLPLSLVGCKKASTQGTQNDKTAESPATAICIPERSNMILRRSRFVHQLPVSKDRTLIVHAISHMRLPADRDISALVEYFAEPRRIPARGQRHELPAARRGMDQMAKGPQHGGRGADEVPERRRRQAEPDLPLSHR